MTDEELRYKNYFQAMPIPRFVVSVEGRNVFKVVEANDLVLKYFGLTSTQIINQALSDFLDPDNQQHFQQAFEVCLSKQRAVTIQSLPDVPSAIRVYGFYISPIKGDDGKVKYLDVVGQLDVADQSILQRERDDAIMLMTSIFEVGEIGIIITDHNGRIIRVNESFIRTYGWSREELINSDFVGLVTPDERNTAKRNHTEFIRTGARTTGELKIIRKDGAIANILYTTATLELSQKRRFQVTTVMDITLRKQMEESLRYAKDQADTASHAKSTFLANMSHELRTPLNAIIGFSEMIIKETFGKLGNEKYKEYLKDVHSSANHLLEIINEVLDMSKIEAGRVELDEEEINVHDLVKSVIRMMESRAFSNRISMRTDISPSLPNLLADERLVRQILINIVANAVKFSNNGGFVEIGANVLDDGRMQINVKDNGIGIPKNRIKQAMEPFGQVMDKAENSRPQGTGLGLPLAKAMTELHEGVLSIDSDIGKGTNVFISFPSYRVLGKKSQGLRPNNYRTLV